MTIAIILTFNSERSIGLVVESCREIAGRIVVVDSYSSDNTVSIAKQLGCDVVQHEFGNYSKQRNWAQKYVDAAPSDWLLHLDSDEVVSSELAKSIAAVTSGPASDVDGYLIRRISYFLGKPIRFGQINPSWHLRLYRADKGFCEDREYDQHYVVNGPTRRLKGILLDLQMVTIEQWIASHNKWSSAEAKEAIIARQNLCTSDRALKGSLIGDPRMQKRWIKNVIWYRSPLFLRAFLFFFWSYFIRLGFLDGMHGLVYHVLQSFWFRFTVDAKVYEAGLPKRKP